MGMYIDGIVADLERLVDIVADLERLVDKVRAALDADGDGEIDCLERLDTIANKAREVYDRMTPEQRALVGGLIERALLALVAGGPAPTVAEVVPVAVAVGEAVSEPAPVEVVSEPAPVEVVSDTAPVEAVSEPAP